MLPGIHVFAALGSAIDADISVALSDLGNTDTTDTNSYTFSGVNVGTGGGRVLVVGATGFSTGASLSITSITISGTSATEVVQAHADANNDIVAGIFVCDLSANGVSGSVDLTVNFSDTFSSCGMSFVVLNGVDSTTAEDFASGTQVSTSSTVTTDSAVETSEGGFTFGVAAQVDDSTSLNWSSLTERSGVAVDGFHEHSVAYDTGSRSSSTESCDITNATGNVAVICVAAFK